MGGKRKENESFAKSVIHFYKNEGEKCKTTVVKHFVAEGRDKKTIYRILKRFLETGNDEYKVFPGRTPIFSSPRTVEKVKIAFESNPNASVRQIARKLGISKSTISHIKVNKLRIRGKTIKKSQADVQDQEIRANIEPDEITEKTTQQVLLINDSMETTEFINETSSLLHPELLIKPESEYLEEVHSDSRENQTVSDPDPKIDPEASTVENDHHDYENRGDHLSEDDETEKDINSEAQVPVPCFLCNQPTSATSWPKHMNSRRKKLATSFCNLVFKHCDPDLIIEPIYESMYCYMCFKRIAEIDYARVTIIKYERELERLQKRVDTLISTKWNPSNSYHWDSRSNILRQG